MADGIDVSEAAAVAKKLASSTNTQLNPSVAAAQSWQALPYQFYSQVPPPMAGNSWFSDMQVEGATFQSFGAVPHPPGLLPSSGPHNQSRHGGYPGAVHTHDVYNFGHQNNRGFSSNNFNNTNNTQNFWSNNNSRPTHRPPMPMPVPPPPAPPRGGIRFQLQTGKKHVFSKPKLPAPLPPTPGVAAPPPSPPPLMPGLGHNNSSLLPKAGANNFLGQNQGGQQHYLPNNNKNGFNRKTGEEINYGLQNGSNWANPSSSAPTSGTSAEAKKEPSPIKPTSVITVWPESLKMYSQKCYEMCIPVGLDTKVMDVIMTNKITQAINSGEFDKKDWSKEPYPAELLTRLKPNNSSGPSGAIPGIVTNVTGKPFLNGFPSSGRGAGQRGRGKGFQLNDRVNALKGIRSSRGSRGGIRGRNRFRSSRSSSSNSDRSRSSSSSSNSSSSSSSRERSKARRNKRKRRSSSSSKDRNEKKKKKSSGKKKGRELKKEMSKRAREVKNMEKYVKGLPRIPHFYKEHGNQLEEKDSTKLSARAERFANSKKDSRGAGNARTMRSRLGGYVESKRLSPQWGIDRTGDDFGLEETWQNEVTVVGTCYDLEKSYLRLTSAPEPSTIRPLPVLRRSLTMVRKKWKENQDYFYACDQLKSIRQDCTVQRIRDVFTVLVYETHGRIALEKGDHEEFNQCQSQLSQLYKTFPESENRVEFTAYKILYYIFTSNSLDMGSALASLLPEDKENECVKHALELQKAVASANYTKFFKLYQTAPKMSSYLIDWFANRERKKALKAIIKAYRPNVPVDFIQVQLGLLSLDDWNKFLKDADLESSIVYLEDSQNTRVNTKECVIG